MREFKVGDRVRFRKEFLVYSKGYETGVVRLDMDGDPVILKPSGEEDIFFHSTLHEYADIITVPKDASASGSLNSYYLSRVEFPQREDQPAYTAECEDLIESLRLNPDEANIFKEIWRSANARLGNGKPDHKALYGAEKINHYAGRNLRRVKREAQK